jgi:hypothetical protein
MTHNSLSLSETEAHRALQVVRDEKQITSEKLTEIDRFRRKVHRMDTVDGSPADGVQKNPGGDVRAVSTQHPGYACGDVIDAFEDTLNNCEEATGVQRAIAGELGNEVAALLLQNDKANLTSELKGAVLLSVDERRSQLRVLEEALRTEQESVNSTVELVESINDGTATEETPVSLGFDELRQRHEDLVCLKEDCESRIQRRQQTLSGTTKEASAAGLRHMSLVECLYEELPPDHPVLSTLTEAVRVCERKEREAREYICRAV